MDENSIKTTEKDESSVVNLDFLKNAFKAFAGSLQGVINGVINMIPEDIAGYNSRITKNTTDIAANKKSIDDYTDTIGQHSTSIASNRKDIDANKSFIDENGPIISQNTTAIFTINNTIDPSARPCIPFVLPTDSNNKQWTQISDSLGYSCTYSSTDINTDYDYIVDLNFSSDDTIDYKSQIEEEWAKITHMEIGEQGVTFYASELPEGDIPIKIKQLF